MSKVIVLTGEARERSKANAERARLKRLAEIGCATPEERAKQEEALRADRRYNLSGCVEEKALLRTRHHQVLGEVTRSMLERGEIGSGETRPHIRTAEDNA